jgi:hypothetical protein
MESTPLHAVAIPDLARAGSGGPPLGGPLRVPANLGEPTPDEPLAVVAAGPAASGRGAVLGALLGTSAPLLRVPPGSFLVVDYGHESDGAAYVPGYRQPHVYRSDPVGAGPALARPPRRVELTLPCPLLRHFAVVDTPDTATLGLAGARVVLDAVGRGGALLFVISAEQTFSGTDLDLLTEVAAGKVAVVFVVTPTADGRWSNGGQADLGVPPVGGDAVPRVDPISVTIGAHRAALLTAVPGLVDAPWFAVDPDAADTAYLRRALVDWAGGEGLHRASRNPPVASGATRTVPVAPDAHESDWEDRLERQVRTSAHRVRQHLALELANIHLRCVREIVFGSGCPGLPDVLDREVHALSLATVAECDAAVARILDETATRVFGEPPDDGVRRRVVAAVRQGFADHHDARDLDRVLLITSTGGVATVTGPGAVTALPAYRGAADISLLPPVGVGLAGGCYQLWRHPGRDNPAKARSWLQRALRDVELELSREMIRRFEAVRSSLTALMAEAVDHGILLA